MRRYSRERGKDRHLLGFTCSVGYPLLCVWPRLVESEETCFTATFYELVWFSDEFFGKYPIGEMFVWSD
jgi:hypothetical protein